MPSFLRTYSPKVLVGALFFAVPAAAAENPFVGNWALTLPGGIPGWLGITQESNYIDASMLWGWGSVNPVESVVATDQTLVFTRMRDVHRKDAQGKALRTQHFTDTYTAHVEGDLLMVTIARPHENDIGMDEEKFTGRRTPPLPPAPDLARVTFGDPIQLFNGRDLTGWRLTDPHAVNGWSAANGLLVNRVVQEEGTPHRQFGNLRTDREFTDFDLTLETRVPKDGNSGVYIRGIYEVQVFDSYGHPLDSHNMGALYSRITPLVSAEKPAGEWQTLDITFVARHLTVLLNGIRIIDNQPVLGITGGALTSDEFKPGPIYLQGDHSGIEYRNIVLRPVR